MNIHNIKRGLGLLIAVAFTLTATAGDSALSLRFGVHEMDDDDTGIVDDGYGLQAEFRIGLGDSPFDLDLRAYYNNTTCDDFYLFDFGNLVGVEIDDMEFTQYGGSAQVMLNINKGNTVNPYVALGAMYGKVNVDVDAVLYRYQYATHFEDSEDGFTYVARAGLECNGARFYARFEASLIGAVFEDDDAQAELLAILGVNITENARLELAVDSYSEWSEGDVMCGITFTF